MERGACAIGAAAGAVPLPTAARFAPGAATSAFSPLVRSSDVAPVPRWATIMEASDSTAGVGVVLRCRFTGEARALRELPPIERKEEARAFSLPPSTYLRSWGVRRG